MASVQGDDRLSGKGDLQSVRRIKAGTGNVQNSISGFFDAFKSPERVVRMGDGTGHLVCAEFYAATVGRHYGDAGGAHFHINTIIFTKGFILCKLGKTAVSIQFRRLFVGFSESLFYPTCI